MKKVYSHILLILAAIMLIGFSNDLGTSPAPNGLCQIVTADIDKELLLRLVNAIRQQGCYCGNDYYQAIAPVTWNNKLEQAAQNHCGDMKFNGVFSHTGSNGSDPGKRITKVGYKWMTYGENIGKGYSNEEAVVAGWLASPGHCKNMMNPDFKEMGVARDGEYWTQVFATRFGNKN